MANKAQLVDAVKALQRSDPGIKQAWWDYCDTELEGIKDPNRHDENALQLFLSQYEGGAAAAPAPRRPAPSSKGSFGKGGGYGGGAGFGGGKGYGGGMNMMVPMQMQMMMGKGGMGGGGSGDLASFIKVGQKQSASFKDAWQAYCGMYGEGINDPARHDSGYIVGFLDYLGQLAQADLGAAASFPMGMMQQPRKRQMDFGKGGGGGPPMKKANFGGGGGGNAQTAALVDRVKALQRSDPETKAAWWAFTDENHGGVHDPAKHSKDVLEEFLSGYA